MLLNDRKQNARVKHRPSSIEQFRRLTTPDFPHARRGRDMHNRQAEIGFSIVNRPGSGVMAENGLTAEKKAEP